VYYLLIPIAAIKRRPSLDKKADQTLPYTLTIYQVFGIGLPSPKNTTHIDTTKIQ